METKPVIAMGKNKDTKLDPEVFSTMRDASLTHYTFKIKSFSLLSKASIERYDSNVFEAGNYKWKLSFYPNGNEIMNENMSLYLAIAETSSLPPGWEVNVIFSLLVFDQFQDKYLTFQDGRVRRFHALKTEWGLGKFIDLKIFNNPHNGYLVNDTCMFGAEVFVIKSEGKGECLSMIEGAVTCDHTWKIKNFPVSSNECLRSVPFIAGGYELKILLYPMGTGEGKGNSISLYLRLNDSATPLPCDNKLYVKFSLSLVPKISGKPRIYQVTHWFSASSLDWGWSKFMTLGAFNDPTKYFLWNSTCIIEAQVTVLGLVSKLS